MNLNVGRRLSHFATVATLLFCGLFAFAGPLRTTYQAKIVRPDGYPLESASVNFKFTILDPSGACILFSESYSNVNMGATGGLVSFSLGSGVKIYPASATAFSDVFSNITPNMACDIGGPASYSPGPNDTRKIVMQFHDGSGWQTLPAMNINAVPYAMYANEADKLSGLQASDFVQVSTIPTCAASQVLQYNGAAFSCLTLPAGVSITSGTIASALGYTPADGASVTTISSGLATVSSSVNTANSLIASVSSTVFSVSSTVSSLNTSVSSLTSTVNTVSGSVTNLTSLVNSVSSSVTSLTASVNSVSSSLNGLSGTVNAVSATVSGLAGTLSAVSSSVTTLTGTVNSVSSSVATLASSFATYVSSQWATSGSSVLYNSGFVGIGTASPTSRLTVGDGASETTFISDANDSITLFGNGNAYFQGRDVLNDVEFIMGTSTSAGEVFSGSMSDHTYSLRTGNNKRITMTASGTVGVGVNSPSAKLHIMSGSVSHPALKFSSGTLTASPQSGSFEYDGFNFYITDGTNTRRTIATTAAAGSFDNVSNITNSADIFLSPVGSVVVSSTTAATNSATGALVVQGGLGVAGNIFSSGTITTSSVIQGASLTATTGLITPRLWGSTAASGNLYLDSTTHATKGYVLIGNTGGNIGMGTTMPLAKLSVDADGMSPNPVIAGTVATFDNESNDVAVGLFTAGFRKASMYFGVTGAASRGAVSYQFNSVSAVSDTLNFNVNTATRMTIAGSGTVGIGTTVPTAMLNVANTAEQDILLLKAHPNQASAWLKINDSSGTTRAYLSPNGNMPQFSLGATNAIRLTAEYGGVGEVPAGAVVTTSGNLSLLNSGNPGVKTVAGYYDGSNYYSAWEIANVASGLGSLLLMKSGGYTGIGVSTPTARLHLASGTSAIAAFKITSGTLTTTPQAGTFEYDGANFYVTDGALVRRTLAGISGGAVNSISTLNPSGNLTLAPTGSVIVSATSVFSSAVSLQNSLTVSNTLGIGTSDTSMANIHIKSTTSTNDIIYIDRADASANLDIYSSYNGLGSVQSGTFAYGVRPANDAWQIWERGYNANWTNLFAVTPQGYVGIGVQAPAYPLHIAVSGSPVVVLQNNSNANSANSYAGWISGKDSANVETWWVGDGEAAQKRISMYSAIAGYDLQMANASGSIYLDDTGFAGIGISSPLTKFHVNSGEIGISNVGVLKNRMGYHHDQANDATTYYHYLGRVSNNDGDMHISGSLSGHDALGQGKAIVDIFVNARNAPYANGAVFGDLMNSNIEVYEDVSGNLDVYLTTGLWSQVNLDLAVAGNNNSYLVNATKTASAPSGTLVYNLKNDSKFNVKNSGYVGIGVSTPATRLHVGDNLDNAHMETNTKVLISGTDSYLQLQGDDTNGSYATGIIFSNVPASGTPNKHWGIAHRTPAASNTLTFGYGTSTASSTLLSNVTTVMALTTSGSLGLGTTIPTVNDSQGRVVHVHSAEGKAAVIHFTTALTGSAAADGFVLGKWTDGQYGDGPIFWNYEPTPMTFATSAITRIFIAGTGEVGINNGAPVYNLDVSGTLRVSGQAYTNTGNGAFSILSDIRYKDVHGNYERGLKDLLKIETIRFNYKKNNPLGSDSSREYVGISAQNLQQTIPEAVEVRELKGTEYLTVNTSPVLWVVINAVKELYYDLTGVKREIASLKEDNKAKEQEIKELKERLDRIEKSLQHRPNK